MKRLFMSLALAAVMAVFLSACNAAPSSSATSSAAELSVESSSNGAAAKIYEIGETATVGDFKVTLTKADFADRLGNSTDGEHYMLPDTSEDQRYSNRTPWAADEGKSILYATATLEYTGETKEDIPLCIAFSADYKGEYHFDESNTNNGLGYGAHIWSNDNEIGQFHYGHTVNEETKFEPLSSDTTRQIRCCVPVPETVVTAEGDELILNLDLIFTDVWISGMDYSNYDYNRISFRMR